MIMLSVSFVFDELYTSYVRVLYKFVDCFARKKKNYKKSVRVLANSIKLVLPQAAIIVLRIVTSSFVLSVRV